VKKFLKKLPWGLKERPLDLYAAIMIFLGGIYILIDPSFPEKSSKILNMSIITAIAFYMIISSVFIITALLINKNHCPPYTLFSEMYGWLFIASATLALSVFYLASIFLDNFYRTIEYWIAWFCTWFFMFVASLLRYSDLRQKYSEMKK